MPTPFGIAKPESLIIKVDDISSSYEKRTFDVKQFTERSVTLQVDHEPN